MVWKYYESGTTITPTTTTSYMTSNTTSTTTSTSTTRSYYDSGNFLLLVITLGIIYFINLLGLIIQTILLCYDEKFHKWL